MSKLPDLPVPDGFNVRLVAIAFPPMKYWRGECLRCGDATSRLERQPKAVLWARAHVEVCPRVPVQGQIDDSEIPW
jgi:hypothetical protein